MKFLILLAIVSSAWAQYGLPEVEYQSVVSPVPAPVLRVEPTHFEIGKHGVEVPVFRTESYAPTPVVRVEPTTFEIKTPAEVKSYGYSTPVVTKAIPIVKYIMEDDNSGTYKMEHVSGTGATLVETGMLKNLGGKEGPVNVKSGSYSFKTPEGKDIIAKWTADEMGFRIEGNHLPTPPPLVV